MWSFGLWLLSGAGADEWVAWNNDGLDLLVAGRIDESRSKLRSSVAAAPRGEAIPAQNWLWLEIVANNASSREWSLGVYEASKEVEKTAKTGSLGSVASIQGPFVDRTVVFPDMITRVHSEGGRYVVFPEPESAKDVRSIADLGLGPKLCDAPGMETSEKTMDSKERYVDAVKRWVTGYQGEDMWDIAYERTGGPRSAPISVLSFAHVGSLNLVDVAVQDVLHRRIPGDVTECGVFRGGTSLVAAASLEVYGSRDRKIFAVDTFAGVPVDQLDPQLSDWGPSAYAASEDTVIQNFRKVGLLDRLVTLPGRFSEIPDDRKPSAISLLRIDADTFQGTFDALVAFYDRVSPDGLIIVDDFHLSGCRDAVRYFRSNFTSPTAQAAPLLPVPLDYVLGCPLRRDIHRSRILAEDLLFREPLVSSSGTERPSDPPQLNRGVMTIGQNIYWRKKN